MKVTHAPLKRTPVVLELDADGSTAGPVATDRSGKVLVSGVERYHGRLHGEIDIGPWSPAMTPWVLPGDSPRAVTPTRPWPSAACRWAAERSRPMARAI